MTGVFIDGMSIPEHCGKCPLAILTHYGEHECFVTECDVSKYMDGWLGRHDNCPMDQDSNRLDG